MSLTKGRGGRQLTIVEAIANRAKSKQRSDHRKTSTRHLLLLQKVQSAPPSTLISGFTHHA